MGFSFPFRRRADGQFSGVEFIHAVDVETEKVDPVVAHALVGAARGVGPGEAHARLPYRAQILRKLVGGVVVPVAKQYDRHDEQNARQDDG